MPKWTKEQELAINTEGSNIIVSAGAGSGKTAVLTERVITKLKKGVHINELLILTFTNNAAAEMKERIKKAYLTGIVEFKDFEEDLKKINEKLEILNNKKQELNELDVHTFTIEKVMARRDIEKISIDNGYKEKEFYKFEWDIKTKKKKQQFIFNQ